MYRTEHQRSAVQARGVVNAELNSMRSVSHPDATRRLDRNVSASCPCCAVFFRFKTAQLPSSVAFWENL